MPLISAMMRAGAKQLAIALVAAAALASVHPVLGKEKAQPAASAAAGPSGSEAPSAPTAQGKANNAVPGRQGEPTVDQNAEAETGPDVWTAEEITSAKAHCDKVLRGVEAVLEPADPIKEGECGSPAPVKLISIGRSPEIVLSPPVTVTCDMVATLASWIKDDLQALARTHLGAPIVRMSTMSSYSCRKAYGRKKTRLSEHGRANAIDVGSFETSSGLKVSLLGGWGMTERDVKAVLAAAKAAAERAAAEKAAAEKAAVAERAGAGKQPALMASMSVTARPSKAPAETKSRRAGPKADGVKAGGGAEALALAEASHLGGPNADPGGVPLSGPDRLSRFLRAAHSSACRRFGTVLGPEANEAHRDHFHLDMAERKRGNYCE